jgi:ketosteroid isomerase-like protein
MSQENVESVRGFYEHHNRTRALYLDAIAADFEWHARADFPDDGQHTGHEGFTGLKAKWDTAFDDFRVEADEVIDAGDYVVVVARMRGLIKGTAQEVELPEMQVWKMRDRKAVEVRAYLTRREALEAAGLEE